jgi:hypothetical protein
MNKIAAFRSSKKFLKLPMVLSIVLVGCITVNVNFPESAVQKAADDFVNDLYKGSSTVAVDTQEPSAKSVKSQIKKKNKIQKTNPTTNGAENGFLNLELFSLIPSAYAQELHTDFPQAIAVKTRMKSRMQELQNLKTTGIICEARDGLVKIKDASKATKENKELVATENKDREELYSAIPEANHFNDPDQKRTRSFFAAAFRSKAGDKGLCD